MRDQLILLLLLILSPYLVCQAQTSTQSWSILKKNFKFESFEIAPQLQHRYNFKSERLYEEQFNLILKKKIDSGKVAFLFTLTTENGYEKTKEYRYALQFESHPLPFHTQWSYDYRLRQEVRFFKGYSLEAYRFRFRQRINYSILSSSKLFLSSEFNVYLNRFLPEHHGLSSHRSIFGYKRKLANYAWDIAYVHDYGYLAKIVRIRNVLRFGLYF